MANTTWREEVRWVVIEAARPISLAENYAAVERSPIVKPYHRQPWKPGGQPRYQCWVRRELTNLCRDRAIRRVGRGLYIP